MFLCGIQPEFRERLAEMGVWLRANGESVYRTRAGPITPRPWGVTTQSATKVYVHVLDWNDELLALPAIAGVRHPRLLQTGATVKLSKVAGGLVLRLPAATRDPVDTVVVLEKTPRSGL